MSSPRHNSRRNSRIYVLIIHVHGRLSVHVDVHVHGYLDSHITLILMHNSDLAGERKGSREIFFFVSYGCRLFTISTKNTLSTKNSENTKGPS